MGRWSASHWKTATFGWLAFVIVSFAVGIAVPMQMIDQKDAAVGEAGKANKIIDEAFDLDKNGQGELVIIQSEDEDRRRSRLPRDDRRRRSRALSRLRAGREAALAAGRRERGSDLARPPRGADHLQPAGHVRRGRALHRLDRRRHRRRPEGPPGLLRRRGGRLDREGARQGDQRRDREGRADRARPDARDPAARARLGRLVGRAGARRADGRVRHVRARLAPQPARADGRRPSTR